MITKKYLSYAVLAAFICLLAALVIPRAVSAVANSWTGGGDTMSWSDADNWSVAAPVNNDTLTFDNTALSGDAVTLNDISNLTVDGISFTGSGADGFSLTNNAIRVNGDIVDDNSGGALNLLGVNMTANKTFRVIADSEATVAVTGNISIGGHNLGLRSYDNGGIFITSTVSGTGKIVIAGDGAGGTLLSNTANLYRPTIVKEGGLLWGNGKTGSLNVTTAGFLRPLQCIQTVNLTIDGYYYTRLGGTTSCTGHSRLNAKGKVDVSGGTLATRDSLEDGFTPPKGSKYVLISNDKTDKIVGTFKNRPEGNKFKIGIYTFRITYKGGSGNDVVLTRL